MTEIGHELPLVSWRQPPAQLRDHLIIDMPGTQVAKGLDHQTANFTGGRHVARSRVSAGLKLG
jgi:hypothetical protein